LPVFFSKLVPSIVAPDLAAQPIRQAVSERKNLRGRIPSRLSPFEQVLFHVEHT